MQKMRTDEWTGIESLRTRISCRKMKLLRQCTRLIDMNLGAVIFGLFVYACMYQQHSRHFILSSRLLARHYIQSLLRSINSFAPAMSVPRVFSQGRLALSRGFATRAPRATGSILRTVGTTLSQRQFSSNVRLQQETIQTPANGAEVPLTATRKASPEINARSIAITKLPKRVVKADIEKFLSSVGIDAYVAPQKLCWRPLGCNQFSSHVQN